MACGGPDEIRSKQAVRDVVEPNIRMIANGANAYIDQFFPTIGLAPLWHVQYELVDWQIQSLGANEYRVVVTVKYSDECHSTDPPGCAEQRATWAPEMSKFFQIDGCTVPAEFQILQDNPITVVPLNPCAENIYYLPR